MGYYEQHRVTINLLALALGFWLGAWAATANAGICDTDPGMCVMTPTGPALVINICGAAGSSGVCTTVQGATTPGTDDPLAIGKSVGNVKVGGDASSAITTLPVDPATALPTPPGWSGPNSPPSTTAQVVTTCSWFDGSEPSGSYASGAACVGLLVNAWNAVGCPTKTAVMSVGTCASGTCTIHRTDCTGGALSDISASYTSGCPAGYTASGGSCSLSDANAVAKPDDSRCGIQRSGNTFSYDSRDNDCTGSSKVSASGVSASGDTAQAGTDRQQVKVKANTDGTTDITVSTVNSRGNTDSTQARVDNSTGKVIGNAKQTQIGSGTLAGTSGNPQGGDCATCATEATLQALRADLTTGAGAKINEQGSTWSTARTDAGTKQGATISALDARKSAADAAAGAGDAGQLGIGGLAQFAAPTSKEVGWLDSLFPAPAACAPLTYAGGSGPRSYTMTLDVCPSVNVVKPLLEWFLAACTLFYIYFCFWRRGQSRGEG